MRHDPGAPAEIGAGRDASEQSVRPVDHRAPVMRPVDRGEDAVSVGCERRKIHEEPAGAIDRSGVGHDQAIGPHDPGFATPDAGDDRDRVVPVRVLIPAICSEQQGHCGIRLNPRAGRLAGGALDRRQEPARGHQVRPRPRPHGVERRAVVHVHRLEEAHGFEVRRRPVRGHGAAGLFDPAWPAVPR